MRKIFIFYISMTGVFKTLSNTRGYYGTTSSLSLTNWYFNINLIFLFISLFSSFFIFLFVLFTNRYSIIPLNSFYFFIFILFTNLYLIYIIPLSSSLLLFTSYCFSLSSFLSHLLNVLCHLPLSFPCSHSLTDIPLYTLALSLSFYPFIILYSYLALSLFPYYLVYLFSSLSYLFNFIISFILYKLI